MVEPAPGPAIATGSRADLGVSASRPNGTVVAAFFAITVLAGINFIGVKFTVAELPPFWGAAMRFGLAAFLLAWFAVLTRLPWPHGRGLLGASVFGLLAFGVSYASAYYALVGITAGLLSVIVATVPLLTLALARMHRLERLTLRNVTGAMIAIVGIAILLSDQIGSRVSLPHLGVAFLMPFAIAEANVLVKKFPRVHPVTLNVVAMTIGAVLLLLLSFVAGETLAWPTKTRTLWAVAYLVVGGSIVMFTLFLFVLRRWSASATSYQLVLTPIVAVALAAALAGETFTWTFFVGAFVVLAGVFVAAVGLRRHVRPLASAEPRSAASANDGPRP